MTDDFDPQKEVKTLYAQLNQPDKFAEVFRSAVQKSKVLNDILRDSIVEALKTDKAKEAVIQIIKGYDKDEKRTFWKETRGKIVAVAIAVLTLITEALISNLIRR